MMMAASDGGNGGEAFLSVYRMKSWRLNKKEKTTKAYTKKK